MKFLINDKYNPDTDCPTYTFLDPTTQELTQYAVPRDDLFSYFLQRNMTEEQIKRTMEEVYVSNLQKDRKDDNPLTLSIEEIRKRSSGKIISIDKIIKYNMFTEKNEVVMRVNMRTAMDVKEHRFKTCHEGHIKKVTRHALDNRWYMGMPYDDELKMIHPEVDNEYIEHMKEMGYPDDIVTGLLTFMFADIPEISTFSFDIETEMHEFLEPSPLLASTPILSTGFKFHNVRGISRPGLVLILSNELRRLDNNEPNHHLRELVRQGIVELEIIHSEYELIMRTFEVLNDVTYPLCVTHFGEGFDFPYLYNRAINLGIHRSRIPFYAYQTKGGTWGKQWKCVFNKMMHIDMMGFFKQPSVQNYVFKGKYKKYGLSPISKALLNRDKADEATNVNEMSLANLAYYNYVDADLSLDLMKYQEFLPWKIIFMFMRIGRQGYHDASQRAIGNKVLNWIQGTLIERNTLIPNKTDLEQIGEGHSKADIEGKGYRGAIVIPSEQGVHKHLKALDFGSLYPGMMKEHNISFDTMNCSHPECRDNIVPELPHHICSKKLGILPSLIGCMKDIRLEYFKKWAHDKTIPEKERARYSAIEQGIKIFVNASYGVNGDERFAMFCKPAAESITAYARDAITRVAVAIEKRHGTDLIAIGKQYNMEPLDVLEHIPNDEKKIKLGDTDSLYGDFDDDDVEFMMEFSREHLHIELELEDVILLAIVHKKKNYIFVDKSGVITVKGLLGKKRNTPGISVMCFNEFKILLKDVALGTTTTKEFKTKTIELVRRYYDKIWNVDGDVGDYTIEIQMKKSVSSYGNVQHARAAKTWIDHVRSTVTALRNATDDSIVPPMSYVRYTKKAATEFKRSKSGKISSSVKCTPVPYQLATKDDITPGYYHDNLMSVMGQVMEAMEISPDEVHTSDPDNPALTEYF